MTTGGWGRVTALILPAAVVLAATGCGDGPEVRETVPATREPDEDETAERDDDAPTSGPPVAWHASRRAADAAVGAGRARQTEIMRVARLRNRDFWLSEFGEYMSQDLREAYLTTPRQQRFRRFGEILLDFQRREALLDRYRARMDPAEVDRYHDLDSYEACRAFLRERFGPPEEGS